jgi:hypothetical protein
MYSALKGVLSVIRYNTMRREWSCNDVSDGVHSFFKEAGFEHVSLLSADGALEAAPAMGAADIILDLVSTGVTLRENNLYGLVLMLWPFLP